MARATALKDSAPPGPQHERHRPEQTLLYRIIDRHYPEFLAGMAEQGSRHPTVKAGPMSGAHVAALAHPCASRHSCIHAHHI